MLAGLLAAGAGGRKHDGAHEGEHQQGDDHTGNETSMG
jgi:hypothetical protein